MRRNERGQAMLVTVVVISVVLSLLIVSLTVGTYSRQMAARQLTYQGQALNAAQAGLTEGVSWFRRQTLQPVTSFTPVQNLGATPQIDDTENPAVGLVRNYQISAPGRVWGRYELQRTGYVDPVTGTPSQTRDISSAHGKLGAGVVWQLESIGTVYIQNDPTKAYNASPNKVIATRVLRSEIQRLALNLPANAALITSQSNALNMVNTDTRIDGGSNLGVAWCNTPAGSTPYGAGYSGQVFGGVPKTSSGVGMTPPRVSIPAVFGLTQQELRGIADIEVTSVAALPAALPDMKLMILNNPGNTFVFNAARPLTGTGILVVFGNLQIAANAASTFNGLVYVQGTYNQSAPSTVNGTVIVEAPTGAGTVQMQGAGDDAKIRFDQGLLNYIARRMGLYNTIRNPYVPCGTAIKGEICD